MSEEFVNGRIYSFDVVGMQPGAFGNNYIYLRRGVKSTYRVKAYPFQIEDPDNLPPEMDCIVVNVDVMSGLPILRQEKVSLLKTLFFVGEEYPFKVTEILVDNNTNATYYVLTDTYGLEHRLYFYGEALHQKSDIFSLKIDAIDEDRGILRLSEIADIVAEVEHRAEQVDTESEAFGTEDVHTEFKSSIVYIPGKNIPDIDKQLHKIIRTISGFMNADGGTLWIGVNDSGYVTGIEADFTHLNSGDDENNGTYKNTPDGYELKIRNTLNRYCGSAVGVKLNFRFLSNNQGKLYCGLDIEKSNPPVFVNGTFMFQRAGNQVLQLKGDDITNFIKERYKEELKGIIGEYILPARKQVADKVVSGDVEIAVPIPISAVVRNPAAVHSNEVYNHFTFYKDGKWSFQKNSVDSVNVEYELPVLKSEKDFPMLMCYDNGCINTVIPSKLRRKKDRGKLYSNGWNTDAVILNIFVTPPYNLVAAFSHDNEGVNRVKVHSVTDFNPVESIRGKGAMIVNPALGNVLKYKQVEIENIVALPNLILEKRFTSQSLGFRVTDPTYRNEIEFLEKLD